MLPKDEQEIQRLDMQHHILKKVLKANYLAPLQKSRVSTILEVGSGTGIWMKEIAEEIPTTRVDGFDLDEPIIQLNSHCSWTRGNLLDGLPYEENSFDFVHQRLLVLGVPRAHWPQVIRELVRVTRPGGWIELVECDLRFSPSGTYTRDFISWLVQASQQRGLDISIGIQTKSLLEAAGLVSVEEQKEDIPLGDWGGHVGTLLLRDFSAAAEKTIKPLITSSLHIDPVIYDFTIKQWKRECELYHETCRFTIAYAQKR